MSKKDRDTILDDLPGVAADYIRLVIRKMRYRRKVQAEVKEELADHFREALSDCPSDEQRNKKARRLIEQFGDAKILGILLRRAKKRCRPLWRTVTARTFQTIGVLILLFVLYVIWFVSGKPVVTKDYIAEYNKLVRPAADESLNAAPFYDKAARILEEVDSETKQLLGNRYNKATAQDKTAIRNWLQQNEQAIELVVTGASKPHYWRIYESPEGSMLGVLMPHLSGYRISAYALRWRAWLSAEQGRFDDAFDDIRTCYRLGQHLTGDTVLIEQLVGMGIRSVAMRALCEILSGYDVPADTMAALQKDLEAMTDNNDFVVSVETEKLFMLDEIQRCFTESRFGPSHIYPRRIVELSDMSGVEPGESWLADLLFVAGFTTENWPRVLHIVFTHPDKEETTRMANEYYAYWRRMMRKAPAELAVEGIDLEEQTTQLIKHNVFLYILAPAMGRVHTVAYRHKMDVESSLMILAVSRYEQDAGRLPETLEQLKTAGYVEKIPIDPFSGKPYSYQVTEDSFLLYSFGANLKDDGGEVARDEKDKIKKWADEGDWVFWPVEVE